MFEPDRYELIARHDLSEIMSDGGAWWHVLAVFDDGRAEDRMVVSGPSQWEALEKGVRLKLFDFETAIEINQRYLDGCVAAAEGQRGKQTTPAVSPSGREQSEASMSKIVRKLKVGLNEEELVQRGDKAARLVGERREKNEQRKLTARTLKAEVDGLDQMIAELSEVVRNRAEWREVECEERRNDAELRFEIVRKDTGEVVETRAYTPDDRQGKLFAIEGKRGAKKAVNDDAPAPADEEPKAEDKPKRGRKPRAPKATSVAEATP